MANGILTLNPNFPERNPEGEKLPLIEAPVGAGIGLALANFLKDKNKENLPEKTDEEKTPQEEPPEDPNLLPELTKQTAEEVIRKEIKKLEDKAFAKFQYMANKEGGQTIGNREILLDLNEELFNKYVKDITKFKNFKEFDKKFPNQTIKLFKRADQKEYQITKVGEVGKDFFPVFGEDPYKIEVKDFNSKKAIKHSKTFDSDVYPIEKAMGGIIDKPLTGNSRYI
jgi:hypothetical protein